MGISASCAWAIEISGRPVRGRYEIKVNGSSVFLSGTSFFYLFQLAWYAKIHPGDWLAKENIEDTGNQARYLYRLRNELAAELSVGGVSIQNNRRGCYRLDVNPADLVFNLTYLRTHPDVRVRQKAEAR